MPEFAKQRSSKIEWNDNSDKSNVLTVVQTQTQLPSTPTERDWCSCEFRFWARRPSVVLFSQFQRTTVGLSLIHAAPRLAVYAWFPACLRPDPSHHMLAWCFVVMKGAGKFVPFLMWFFPFCIYIYRLFINTPNNYY